MFPLRRWYFFSESPFESRSRSLLSNITSDAGNFLNVTMKWSSSDELTLQLPISPRTEAIQGNLTVPRVCSHNRPGVGLPFYLQISQMIGLNTVRLVQYSMVLTFLRA